MQPERVVSAQTVGPYRLLDRLGAGGMGEVFLAYDERLDRRVAIKRIRTDAGVTPERRERFRREARMAARLSHPAVVQVFDILQEDDTDSIVMEYVDGTNLRELVDGGPLDARTVVELARELADGLEAAHRSGIVHRDLKTENVLVGPSGRPKVTDFGVAKHLLAEEESLTGDHKLIGTCRSMSPEQARGEPVDHRTDLFAMGVLLYEMLTGRSPFAAETPLATITRVLHHRQTPVRELVPAVPVELSNLVDHLLQKDRNLRPRNAGQVKRELERLALTLSGAGGTETVLEMVPPTTGRALELPPTGATVEATSPSAAAPEAAAPARRSIAAVAALVILTALAVATYLALRPAKPPLYVAVLAPEVGAGAGSGEVELLASGVRVALLQGLVSLENLSPQIPEEGDELSGSRREVARALAADEVVAAQLSCPSAICRVALTRHRGTDGSVIRAESFDVPLDDPVVAAEAVKTQISRLYPDQTLRTGSSRLKADPRDVGELLRLRQRLDSVRATPPDALLAEVEAFRRRSPRFLEAYMLEIQVLRQRFWASRDPAELERALNLLHEAQALAPEDPRPLLELFDLSLAGGKLDQAESSLREAERLLPGDVRLLERRAELLDARGRSEEALETMRSAANLRPSLRRLHSLAQMELRGGEIAAARRALHRLLEISPLSYRGLSLLAQLELLGGDLQRAVDLYSRLVDLSPGLVELSNLGLAYTLLGRYAEAEAVLRRVYEMQPSHPALALNLADACHYLGRTAEAEALYRRVIELIHQDPSATGPQFLTVEAQALAHLNQGPKAVAAIQEALRAAPDQGPVAFEAALTYALLGEEDSALANAATAIRLGVGKRWFSLPWFAPLARRPDFQALLRQARLGFE